MSPTTWPAGTKAAELPVDIQGLAEAFDWALMACRAGLRERLPVAKNARPAGRGILRLHHFGPISDDDAKILTQRIELAPDQSVVVRSRP